MQSNCKLWFGFNKVMMDGYIDEQSKVYLVIGDITVFLIDKTFEILKITVYPG